MRWLIVLAEMAMATMYGGAAHEGRPLYCDRNNGLVYRADRTWVAVDVSEYEAGRVRCGDELWITFADGQVLKAPALDAGYLYPHIIAQAGLPIVVDVPSHMAPFPGLSAQVRTVINHSAAIRILETRISR